MKAETYNIWIKVTVGTSTYQFESDNGEAEMMLVLPKQSATDFDFTNVLSQLAKIAVQEFEHKQPKESDG